MSGDVHATTNGSATRRGPDETAALEPLMVWLEEDPDAIADAIERAILMDLPGLADADAEIPSLRASIASHLPAIAASIRDGTPAQLLAVPEAADAYTRHLVHQGVALVDLLRSYDVGHAALWTTFAETLRDGANRLSPERRADALELASLRIFDYLQTVTARAVTTYTREQSRLERRAASRRAEAVAAVLAGTLDGSDAEQALGGYPLTIEHIAYVAWAHDDADVDGLDRFVTNLPGRIGARYHLDVPIGDATVHGWFAAHNDRMRDVAAELELPAGIGLAVGSARRGVDGFRATHREALESRRVSDLGQMTGPICYPSIVVAALASQDLGLARDLVERELGAVLGADDGTHRLLHTLGAYLEELASPTRTARRLGVHTNTVVKRLERIDALRGGHLDPSSSSLRVAVELAPLVWPAQEDA